MRETMIAAHGAGLAAPQIGVLQRVVIFGFEHNDRYPDAEPVPYTEIVNPVLTPLSAAMEEDWEGCLSVPGLRGRVPRHTALRYTGFDPSGRPIEREVSGFTHASCSTNAIISTVSFTRCACADLRLLGYTDVLFPDEELVDE